MAVHVVGMCDGEGVAREGVALLSVVLAHYTDQ